MARKRAKRSEKCDYCGRTVSTTISLKGKRACFKCADDTPDVSGIY
jgi:hypothetical protein